MVACLGTTRRLRAREGALAPQSAAPPRSCRHARQLRACPPAAASSCRRGMLIYELGEMRPARTKCSQKNHVAGSVAASSFPQRPRARQAEHAAMMRLLLCCLVAFGDAQLRPRRVGVSPMGEETGAAEAGGAEPDMANLMKNMMGGGASTVQMLAPAHATTHRSRGPRACSWLPLGPIGAPCRSDAEARLASLMSPDVAAFGRCHRLWPSRRWDGHGEPGVKPQGQSDAAAGDG